MDETTVGATPGCPDGHETAGWLASDPLASLIDSLNLGIREFIMENGAQKPQQAEVRVPIKDLGALRDAVGNLNPILRAALEVTEGGHPPVTVGYNRLTFSRSWNEIPDM
ncbi:hypothetical protein [Streptomyces sp. WAC 01325]|uniref:hypothetical protein n=1 Tax=Streptomyces sp. WAC 01325 TaxID=2203202 RepID=UPI000F85BE58|nr:hypothetical protein [Streptomyces sp. WAC 01325]